MIHIPEYPGELPWVTADQMREIDRLMTEELGITALQVAENAGRCIADLVRRRCLGGDPRGSSVTLVAGAGGNGVAVLVAARRLAAWGSDVAVRLARPLEELEGVPLQAARAVREAGIPVAPGPPERSRADDVVVEGLIGYGLDGPPRGGAAELITWLNDQLAPVLSHDVPSGIDATTGEIMEPAVRAGGTICPALPRIGLRAKGVASMIGELYIADIAVPPALYARPSLQLQVGPIFAGSDLLQVPLP